MTKGRLRLAKMRRLMTNNGHFKRPLRSSSDGFSLIEVLVALTIVAIALVALTKQLSHQADTLGGLRDRVLGHWVAENQLARDRSLKTWPEQGTLTIKDDLAGRNWMVKKTITNTPNETIRQVELVVSSEQGKSVARLIGYIIRPVPD